MIYSLDIKQRNGNTGGCKRLDGEIWIGRENYV